MKTGKAMATAAEIVTEFQAGIPKALIGPNKVQMTQLRTLREGIYEALLGNGKTAQAIVAEFRAGVPANLIGPNKLQLRQLETLRKRIAGALGK